VRILDAVRELDDRAESMAEVCRRVAASATAQGLTRPSYVHVRRLIRAERDRQDEQRERREALKEIAGDVAFDLVAGRMVNAYAVADRVASAKRARRAP
jgi:hypothetical protein